jgi:hypothetical protein
MIKEAVRDKIPREIAWLQGYDAAFSQLNDAFDLPRKDLSALIRMGQSNMGVLSAPEEAVSAYSSCGPRSHRESRARGVFDRLHDAEKSGFFDANDEIAPKIKISR